MNDAANPLLDTIALPRFAEIVPEQIAPALDAALADHEAMVETLTTTRPAAFADVWLPYERAQYPDQCDLVDGVASLWRG